MYSVRVPVQLTMNSESTARFSSVQHAQHLNSPFKTRSHLQFISSDGEFHYFQNFKGLVYSVLNASTLSYIYISR